MEAKAPGKLTLYEEFGKNSEERAIKWRWLGYALSGEHVHDSSIRHLRVEDDHLTEADVRDFVGLISSRSAQIEAAKMPPSQGEGDRTLCVRLAVDSRILLSDGQRRSRQELGLMDDSSFLVVDDADDVGLMTILVPGYGVCKTHCASVVDAVEASRPSSSSSSRFNLQSFQCGVDKCETRALTLLTSTIGHSLVRLTIGLKVAIYMDPLDAVSFAESFPSLEFLALTHVGLGSMDALLSGYESGACRIAVLSMTNSLVSSASMTRFVRQLQDPSSRVSQCLREFRYLFEDYDIVGTCPQIITMEGASAIRRVLATNATLTFLDIGLVKRVYDRYFESLNAYDNTNTSNVLTSLKVAFLSVLRGDASDENELKARKKRPRTTNIPRVLAQDHRLVTTLVWRFLERPVNRVVSVVSVPRPL